MAKQKLASYVPDDFDIDGFQNTLLAWFERHQRHLPWRMDRSPYKIWVSEVMLQQTRVDTVIPYFNRFLERFPTLLSLAEAPEDEVLKAWEGLGYYSRARNLQQAAREVCEKYGGKVPDKPEEISRLKGVGPYTAGAILSIAYQQPEPAVDGNVMRVLSRILMVEEDVQKATTRKKFEEAVRRIIAKHNPSFFNQALMELGALICTPKSPQCSVCPVASFCMAKKQGIQEQLPVKEKAKPPRKVDRIAGIIIRSKNAEILINKRPDKGLLAGLWELPSCEIAFADGTEQDRKWQETLAGFLYRHYGMKVEPSLQWMTVQHAFSHLHWNLRIYRCRLDGEDPMLFPASAKWVKISELTNYAFPVPYGKVIQQISATTCDS